MITIFRGLPGTGKSTAAKELGIPLIEADMYWGKDYKFDMARHHEARDWCLLETKRTLFDSQNVVVTGMFSDIRDLMPYYQLGHKVKFIEMIKEFGSIHGLTVDRMQTLRNQWAPLLCTQCQDLCVFHLSVCSECMAIHKNYKEITGCG